MKNRWIIWIMMAVLVLTLIPQGSVSVFAEEAPAIQQSEADFDDEYAWIEFLTEPIYEMYGPEDWNLRVCHNCVWHYDGDPNGAVLLSPFGRKLSDERISAVMVLTDQLWAVQPSGSSKYALYRYTGERLTDAVYEDFRIQCGCVIAVKGERNLDLFDRNGRQYQLQGKLGGYDALFVTPAGTIVAGRKSGEGASGLYDRYRLLDRNGTVLLETYSPISQASPGVDWCLDKDNAAVIDLYGNVIANKMGSMLTDFFGKEKDCLYMQMFSGEIRIYDAKNKRLQTFECPNVRIHQYGDVLLLSFYKTKEGQELGDATYWYSGLLFRNGTLISDPSYNRGGALPEEWKASQLDSQFLPQPRWAALKSAEEQMIYNDQGTLLASFPGDENVKMFLDSIRVTDQQGNHRIYDANGTLRKEYTNGEDYQVWNGVPMVSQKNSKAYYVVDLDGNRLSADSYDPQTDERFTYYGDFGPEGMYGLVNVKKDKARYVINGAGAVQNTEPMDKTIRFSFSGGEWLGVVRYDDESSYDPGLHLGVYYQNGKAGICRYVPAVGACEKRTDGKHNWEQEEIVYPASCAERGMVRCCCASCGKTKVVTTPKDETRHVKGSFVKVVKPVSGGKHGTAKYKCAVCGKTFTDEFCTSFVFRDMPPEDDPAHMAIDWAYTHKPYQVTAGMDATHFGPERTVTRAQAMTFFWAAKDKPKPKTQTSPFLDVKKKDWYYKPVLWAVENGITAGTDATHFSPNKTCNRGEILTFLYAAVGKPKVKIKNPYQDVTKQWYKKAALWAWVNRIERGENGKFNASTPCTRASTVTYLYRFLTGYGLVE